MSSRKCTRSSNQFAHSVLLSPVSPGFPSYKAGNVSAAAARRTLSTSTTTTRWWWIQCHHHHQCFLSNLMFTFLRQIERDICALLSKNNLVCSESSTTFIRQKNREHHHNHNNNVLADRYELHDAHALCDHATTKPEGGDGRADHSAERPAHGHQGRLLGRPQGGHRQTVSRSIFLQCGKERDIYLLIEP